MGPPYSLWLNSTVGISRDNARQPTDPNAFLFP